MEAETKESKSAARLLSAAPISGHTPLKYPQITRTYSPEHVLFSRVSRKTRPNFGEDWHTCSGEYISSASGVFSARLSRDVRGGQYVCTYVVLSISSPPPVALPKTNVRRIIVKSFGSSPK